LYSRVFPIVDLPEPDRPVSQITQGFCCFNLVLCSFFTFVSDQKTLDDFPDTLLLPREEMTPAPLVLLVILSITMNDPVSSQSSNGSTAICSSSAISQLPISLI